MDELQAIAQAYLVQVRDALWALEIPVSKKIHRVVVNHRAKTRLGCCVGQGDGFVIEIGAGVLRGSQAGDMDQLKEVMAHELLHTCPGCQNHGQRWKGYAQLVNAAWGCQISRLAPVSQERRAAQQRQAPYLLACSSCGRAFPRMRSTKVVLYPARYRCPCGGPLVRVR